MTTGGPDQSPGTTPAISVVIAAYNCSATLPATLRSVLAQTIAEWEVVIVDDRSTDDLHLALAEFRDESRIRVLVHEQNAGATAARNTGIAAARGRFIAFLDADDSWLPTKLQRQLETVLTRPDPDATFCVTHTVVTMSQGRYVIRPKRPKRRGERLDEFIFVSGGFCQTSSFFVSRSLASAVQFRELPTGEDHLFAIDVCDGHGAEYILIEEPLTIYNDDVRPGRLSRDKSLARGRQFMTLVKPVLSRKALLAYEARYLGALILRENPLGGLGLLLRALAARAMSPRYAAALLLRAVVPAQAYDATRARLLGQKQSRASPSS